jgi:hypothetical protein
MMCVDMYMPNHRLGSVLPRHHVMTRKASSQSQFCNEELDFIVDTLSRNTWEEQQAEHGDSSVSGEEHDAVGPVFEPLYPAHHGALPGLKRSLSLPHEWSASARGEPADGARTKRACSADDNNRFAPSEPSAAAAAGEMELASLPDTDLYDGEEEGESAGVLGGKQKKPQWTDMEERILLHLVWHFAEHDLRWIAQVAQRYCNVRRSTRAVDKKLRRVLFYTRWQARDNDQIRQHIRNIIVSNPLPLSPDVQSTVQRLAGINSAPLLPSLSDLDRAAAGSPA